MSGRHPGHWWVAGWKWFHPFPEWCSCRQRTVLLVTCDMRGWSQFQPSVCHWPIAQLYKLKRYSVISLWHESEDINKKEPISKISVDSNFMFSSYAWLCVFHCSHRQLCWIKSLTQDFLWVLLSIILKWFQPNSFGKVCFLEESYENMQKIPIVNILRAPSFQHQGVCL